MSIMTAPNRKALLQQLDETRNTVERQSLLKQIWRLDRELQQQQNSETYALLPSVPDFAVSAPTAFASQ
jgi:hypothetical protein